MTNNARGSGRILGSPRWGELQPAYQDLADNVS
jgi:hypothetical protein